MQHLTNLNTSGVIFYIFWIYVFPGNNSQIRITHRMKDHPFVIKNIYTFNTKLIKSREFSILKNMCVRNNVLFTKWRQKSE